MMENVMEKKNIHMIGNTHIDPVWLWQKAEGMQEVKSSFASALDRLDEFPNFKFTQSSISFLAWMKENCPEQFERIRARVAEGRWEIVGGMWVEPDCDLPSGEALIRHFLYSKKFVRENFDKDVVTAYNVDSFGHGSNMPAICSGCGIRYYLMSRPDKKHVQVPPVFTWRSKDGSSVIAERTGGEYMAWTRPALEWNLSESIEALEEHGYDRMAVFYGVGNHGGGPTIDNIHTIYEMRKEREDVTMDFSTIGEFFEQVEPDRIPVVSREMGRIFFGCYSSDCEIKTLLFNQFHDVLAGTSIEPARNRTCMELGGVVAAAEEITEDAVQAIANRLDTRGDGFPLLLVNPTGTDYRGVCGASVYVPRAEKKNTRMRDAAGKEIACAESSYDNFAPEARKFLLFEAEIPAYGYVIYRVISEGSDLPEEESTLTAQEDLLDNGVIRVSFDRTAGAPTSIVKEGRELLTGSGSFAVYYDDRGSWGEHVWEEKVCGVFHVTGRKVVEVNQMRAILRFFLEYGKSEMMVDYILEKGSDRLKMRLILLRSSSFARGGRGELEQNLEGRFMNQGCYDYELMLIPHEGQMKKKRLFAEADFLHMPVSYMGDSNHVGKEWLRCGSILSIDKDNHVHVSSVKTSEYDRGELVVRLFETEGTNSSASVSADGVQESLEFAPYEIKTLRLTADGWKACSMIEYC
jgi:alpha-mannosidase